MDFNRKEKNHHEKQEVTSNFSLVADKSRSPAEMTLSAPNWNDGLTANSKKSIMTVEEVAQFMGKSASWVYKNSHALGGRKLGGSLFFPSKEDLYDNLFCEREREGVEVRLHPQGDQVYGNLVRNKKSGQTGRGRKTKGGVKSQAVDRDANRHGLFGSG